MKRERKSSICNMVAMAAMLLLLLGVGGCASKKSSASAGSVTMKELKSMQAVSSDLSHLSSKVKLTANIAGKEFSANGNVKIKRGEGMLISINALGGLIEVARVELTPEKMLLIYRLGREYAEVRYSDVEALGRLGIDYPMVEAIMLNEIFTPDGKPVEKYLSKMDVAVANGEILLTTEREKGMQYTFHVEQSSGSLQLTRGNYDNKLSVDCNYSDFSTLGTRLFPRQIRFSVANYKLDFKLSGPKADSFKLNGTTDLSSYKKVDISTLLNGIKF